MTKERMIALLDEQIVCQNRLVQEDGRAGRTKAQEEHKHMRNGLVLAKLTLRENWDEQTDKR